MAAFCATPKCHPRGQTCRFNTTFQNVPIGFPSLSPCCHFQREQWKQQRRRQQTEPAVPAGRRKVSHVQLGGRVFSTAEPRPELSAFTSGQHEPPGGLRLLHVRFGGSAAGAQHARTPAPTAGLLVGTSNLQSCGFGLLKRLPLIILYKNNPPSPLLLLPQKRRLISIRLNTCMK